jgi:hypothetical protein
MKIVTGDYNNSETDTRDNQTVDVAIKELKSLFKTELVTVSKNKMEAMSGDSEDSSFVKIEGTQEEMEEICLRFGWVRFVGWADFKTIIPTIGLQVKNKKDKKLYTVTNINSSQISICSRRGIISQIPEIDLFENFQRV